MKRLAWSRSTCIRLVCGIGLFLSLLPWRAGGVEPDKPLGQSPAVQPEAKPSAPAGKPADPFAVPDAKPAELLEFLVTLSQKEPPGEDEASAVFYRKRSQAFVAGADKIFAANPTAEQAEEALQYKFLGLKLLARLQDQEAAKKLAALPDELAQGRWKHLVHALRVNMVRAELEDDENPSEETLGKIFAQAKELIDGHVDGSTMGLATDVAMAAEYAGHGKLAIRINQEFAKLLAASSDRQVAAMATMLEGAARRLDLVGKPIEFQSAKRVDGQAFDWNAYKNKVVLVDFWATWCGPCRAEIPNIARNYEAFHDQGFDVISVSLDQDRKALEDFLAENKHPWAQLIDNPQPKPGEPALATYYGIFGIPQMILVGRDGKVHALNVRGPQLEAELKKLLGTAAEKPAEKGKTADTAPAGKGK